MAQTGVNPNAAAAADLLRQAMAQKYVPIFSFEQTSFVLGMRCVWLDVCMAGFILPQPRF
ncbi:uncharacterized protein Z519_05330 [Cladophialophora bantiana CBS 173.52]|uniref:Uncharacterized protein n=1 Tax=Cladophialophora bantiana (strain ATCC 10958 / CBS 173.52 / CDC B-1940 / NIH 8579) TaxID=1442370 RepID=A0A0D2IB47_CLAB1|nr:uncharacterized protein Z519_05330 [Cladophialophora bantiana CBS 173.52]KIW94014.1 hypothetical protein Z519_05330 [Cladophialophora bantiana CBS 173.52]